MINKMTELRGQGMSYGNVVCWLNVNGVKTKSRSATWDRPTVYGILKKIKSLRYRAKLITYTDETTGVTFQNQR